MRYMVPFIIVITLVLALMFYGFSSRVQKTIPLAKLTGMPWQIDILPNGHTRVFGLVPGETTLKQAIAVLGTDYELAVVESKTSTSLEMYYSDYHAGPIAAKLVLVAKVDPSKLEEWKKAAIKKDYMGSANAKKYILAAADRDAALSSVLRAIAFVPSASLDDAVISKRFGKPAEKIEAVGGVTYYLYPKRGLSIALSSKAKEVLQYVAPLDFDSLQAPLHSH